MGRFQNQLILPNDQWFSEYIIDKNTLVLPQQNAVKQLSILEKQIMVFHYFVIT